MRLLGGKAYVTFKPWIDQDNLIAKARDSSYWISSTSFAILDGPRFYAKGANAGIVGRGCNESHPESAPNVVSFVSRCD
jgi:hypothetical protein